MSRSCIIFKLIVNSNTETLKVYWLDIIKLNYINRMNVICLLNIKIYTINKITMQNNSYNLN